MDVSPDPLVSCPIEFLCCASPVCHWAGWLLLLWVVGMVVAGIIGSNRGEKLCG